MIKALNLDDMFRPIAFSELRFTLLQFSGGEFHFVLKDQSYDDVEKVVITHRVNTPADIVLLHIAADALRKVGIRDLDLVMPYLPYARQDRHNEENYGESFTLEVFANLINLIGFKQIYSLDVHSDVAPALIKNLKSIKNLSYVVRAIQSSRTVTIQNGAVTTYIKNPDPIWLISPDSGANKKANKLYSDLSKLEMFTIKGLVKCDKQRDVKTGKLSGFEIPSIDFEGLDCIIVDDICDGGGTFVGLGHELKKRNINNLYLFVSHGIFSQGYQDLGTIFKEIYTTNSFKDIDKNYFVHQFKFEI